MHTAMDNLRPGSSTWQGCQTKRLFCWRFGLCPELWSGSHFVTGRNTEHLLCMKWKVQKHTDRLKYRIPVQTGAGSTGEELNWMTHSYNSADTTSTQAVPGNLNETETSQEQPCSSSETETAERSSSPAKQGRSTRVRQSPDRYGHWVYRCVFSWVVIMFIIVTVFGKTRHMGSGRDLHNARL